MVIATDGISVRVEAGARGLSLLPFTVCSPPPPPPSVGCFLLDAYPRQALPWATGQEQDQCMT